MSRPHLVAALNEYNGLFTETYKLGRMSTEDRVLEAHRRKVFATQQAAKAKADEAARAEAERTAPEAPTMIERLRAEYAASENSL